jgi:hypothetical protein
MNNKVSTLDNLLADVRQLINDARQKIAVTVNTEMTLLYWKVGRRINDEVLQGKRAEYGKEVLGVLSQALTTQYGKGWSEAQLRKCLRFALTFSDERIVDTLCTELRYSHIRLLISMDDPLKREFYVEICKLEHWSVRQLQERINSMLYERTGSAKITAGKPAFS